MTPRLARLVDAAAHLRVMYGRGPFAPDPVAEQAAVLLRPLPVRAWYRVTGKQARLRRREAMLGMIRKVP